jgi:hypothetical protein
VEKELQRVTGDGIDFLLEYGFSPATLCPKNLLKAGGFWGEKNKIVGMLTQGAASG